METQTPEIDLTCLNYKELAEKLKLDFKTLRSRWKNYPHFFVTPNGWQKPRLESARFDYHEVLNHCKAQSKGLTHDNDTERILSPLQREEREIPGVLQVSRKTAVQSGRDSKGRQTVGTKKEKGDRQGTSKAQRFDVFRRVI